MKISNLTKRKYYEEPYWLRETEKEKGKQFNTLLTLTSFRNWTLFISIPQSPQTWMTTYCLGIYKDNDIERGGNIFV